MKTLLISINSKFVHSNLALKYIKSNCDSNIDIDIKEFTINQHTEYITDQILSTEAELLCFSCYIWNIHFIEEIIFILKTAKPSFKILLGGPEVSFEMKTCMEKNDLIDFIIFGEGEHTFSEFVNVFNENGDFSSVDGLAYRDNVDENFFVQINKDRELISDLNELITPYRESDNLENKIVYFESSRGCPFRCSFCMSSIDKTTRFFSLDRVKNDLTLILSKNPKQIKFVDRTFNADYKRAMQIMDFIVANNSNNTSIHFEITADIMNDEFLDFLEKMPVNMFQLEIGVQSMNYDTLQSINRKTNIERLKHVITKILNNNNMHIHLDLIAGLPFEDYDTFKNSFNSIHELKAHKVQLGFLKVLKGTEIYSDAFKYDIKYNLRAPYEIIRSEFLSYQDVLKLKHVEELVERYYNEQYFENSIDYIIKTIYCNNAFDFYEDFSDYWKKSGLFDSLHSRKQLYKILFEFSEFKGFCNDEFSSKLLYDFVFNNEKEELLNIFDKNLEDDFRLIKRALAKDSDFRYKYLGLEDDKYRALNNFRIIMINDIITLFVFKDKTNVFARCKSYDITLLANEILNVETERNI